MADPAVKTEYEGDTIIAVITKTACALLPTLSSMSAVLRLCRSTAINTATAAPCVSCAPQLRPRVVTTSPAWKNGQQKTYGLGAMSGSCKLFKESLAPEIVTELERQAA
ncbi:MAG: hypothetical protein ACLRXQ_06145 [Phascolarctobacterium faecium]